MSAPVKELMVDSSTMMPKEIGFVSAKYLFNTDMANIISIIIGVFLISSISSMVITGPRVIQKMINDYPVFQKMKTSDKKMPILSIWIQSALAILVLLSGSFDSILTYTTFALTLFSLLTVIGVFILRKKTSFNQNEKTYKTWGYPITPLIFIVANIWFLSFLFKEKTHDSLIAIGLIVFGFVVYYLVTKFLKNKTI